jgi:hypothetical protein
VHGNTTIYFDGTSTISGSSNWTYGSLMRSGEQVAYSGGPITVPYGAFGYVAAPIWDNVRCP